MERRFLITSLILCVSSYAQAMDLPAQVQEIECHEMALQEHAKQLTQAKTPDQIEKYTKRIADTIKQDAPKIDRLLSECTQLPDGVADDLAEKLRSIKTRRDSLHSTKGL